jgi:hypothetical protein
VASHEIKAAQHRVALTLAYLKVVCPGVNQSTRTKLADAILALMDGEDLAVPQRRITDAQVVEAVWRHSQCVLHQRGKCPLLVFGNQLAEEINEFFAGEK